MRSVNTLILTILLGALVTACQTPLPSTGAFEETPELYLANETNIVVLVDTAQSANDLTIKAARRGYSLNERTTLTGLDLLMLEFERPSGVSGAIAISDMVNLEPSATAGVDHLYTVQSEAQRTTFEYASDVLGWPVEGCDARLSIGIIDGALADTLTSLSHPEIIQNDFTGSLSEPSEHGTAVAEILIGNGRLQAPRLHVASVLSSFEDVQGAGAKRIILALNWLAEADVKLVNISLAGPNNALLNRAIKRATSEGMIIVAAAGNSGPDAPPRYPAAFEEVIAVTAIDQDLEVYDRAVQGRHIEYAAPGVDIYLQSISDGKFLSGTSMAAPFVTALIATHPDIDEDTSIRDVRRQIATSIKDIGPVGKDPIFGSGLLQQTWDCE